MHGMSSWEAQPIQPRPDRKLWPPISGLITPLADRRLRAILPSQRAFGASSVEPDTAGLLPNNFVSE
jgi:hypothetical protein